MIDQSKIESLETSEAEALPYENKSGTPGPNAEFNPQLAFYKSLIAGSLIVERQPDDALLRERDEYKARAKKVECAMSKAADDLLDVGVLDSAKAKRLATQQGAALRHVHEVLGKVTGLNPDNTLRELLWAVEGLLKPAAPAQSVAGAQPVAEFEGYEDGRRPLFKLHAAIRAGAQLYAAPPAQPVDLSGLAKYTGEAIASVYSWRNDEFYDVEDVRALLIAQPSQGAPVAATAPQGDAVGLQKLVDAKQAEIDRLMLEFCPGEMTAEQMETWGAHQRRAPEPEQDDGPEFTIADPDLNALLNGVVDWVTKPQNMDSGLYFADLVEKVEKRLAQPTSAAPSPAMQKDCAYCIKGVCYKHDEDRPTSAAPEQKPIGYVIQHDSAGGNFFTMDDVGCGYKGMKQVYGERCKLVYDKPTSAADSEDAARYRWLCDGNGYFMEENGLCGHGKEKQAADEAIDAARNKEADKKGDHD